MSNRTEICIPRILKHEGGFVNHPNDPGGATNKGITIATFRRYIKRNGTVAELKAMTDAQAIEVYKRQYWDAVQADLLPVGVDYAVADFAVNSGPSRAAKHLQAVVGASRDGRIGPNTLKAVNQMPARDVVVKLTARRMAFLRGLRTWATFGKGWKRRVDGVQSAALADITEASILTSIKAIPAHPKAPPAVEVPKQGFFAWLSSLFHRK